ncbi:MAG: hypothetical protein HN348_27305, partial [Proteobacteria bacterium]|nr:hypothetical protein [Pseudomonadota bacterium]
MLRRHLLTVMVLSTGACEDNLTFLNENQSSSSLPCLPNLDGTIESHEMAPSLDQVASYIKTASGAENGDPVDVTGYVDDSGRRVWDWSSRDDGDTAAQLIARPLYDQWYVKHFPEGSFALPADLNDSLHGIYSHDETALKLYGIASAEESPAQGQTLMVYEEPILFFPFPFHVGKSWTQTGIVRNGTLMGLTPWSQDDLYEVEVDAAGELRLPDFTFTQALRVHTQVTIQPLTGTDDGYIQHQHSFVFECFGEVARASSLLATTADEDPGAEFERAAEIR